VCQITEADQKITAVYYVLIHFLWEKTFYIGSLWFHIYEYFLVPFMDAKKVMGKGTGWIRQRKHGKADGESICGRRPNTLIDCR
jgi:hypothetical protein